MSDKSQGTYPLKVIPGYFGSGPGIQLATQMRGGGTEEEMQFARQLGVEWVMASADDPSQRNADGYRAIRERFEANGLRLYRLANHSCHNMEEITLNLPGRDAKLEEYLQYIRDLGQAGIYYSTYAHMANGIWSTGRAPIRGGAQSREFRLQDAQKGNWIQRTWDAPLTHGREYSEEELWENYAYFIERVVPVAEEAGVFIGIHPDDPPVYPLGGIPRCIFGNFEGYRRAIEMADSANVGMCLCVGCWLEGGLAMGRDVVETIRYFGKQHKLFKLHLRNVTAPMPEGFAETYLDAGYQDMWQVLRALLEIDFDGCIISDHLPQMVGGRYAAEAFSLGYLRALIQSVNNEAAMGC